MASIETAFDLCERVRSDVGVYDRDKLRDGFIDDLGTAPIDVLSHINEGLNLALGTGYRKCRIFIAVVSGQREYPINYRQGNITYLAVGGRRIEPKRIKELLITYPTMLDPTKTNPQQFPIAYYEDRPDFIGFYPPMNYSDVPPATSIEIMAEVAGSDLIVQTDIPSRLPEQFQSRCRYYASWQIALKLAATGVIQGDPNLVTLLVSTMSKNWNDFLTDLQAWSQTPEEPTVAQVQPGIELGGDWGMDVF